MGIEAEEFFESQHKVHEQNAALQEICSKNDAIISAITDKLGTNEDLANSIQLLIDDKDLLVENAAALEKEAKEAKELSETLESQVKLLSTLKSDLEKEIKELKTHSDGLEELLQEREMLNLDLESKLKNMTTTMEERESQNLDLEDQLKTMTFNITSSTAAVQQEFEEQINQLTNENN